ncbi:MAG: hypothetical protein ACRYFR_10815 [Janthinobacterium lividum]
MLPARMQPFFAQRTVRRRFVHRKLIMRLRMFALVFTGIVGAVGYQVVKFHAHLLPVLGSVGLGLGLGLLVGRMAKVTWQEDAAQVVAKMDKLGGLILGLYLVVSLARWWVLGHWFAGHELTAVALSFTGGIMLGRLLFTRHAVVKALKAQEKY